MDPIRYEAGDVNLYRALGNDPLNRLDPSGLFWYPGKYLLQLRREYYRGQELDRQINQLRAKHGLPELAPSPHWTDVAATEFGGGLVIGLQANVNALATASRSLVTLGFWSEPWEVWAVDDADRPFYEGGFLAAKFGWELLPTAGIGRLTQTPGQMGRWGRYALYWDAGQNTVQVGRGTWDIHQNGLTWGNGLQVGVGLLGLGGNYITWRLSRGGPASVSLISGTSGRVGPAYNPQQLEKILENLKQQGVTIIRGEQATGMLGSNANAAYITIQGERGILILRDGATRLEIMEELIHHGQAVQAGFQIPTNVSTAVFTAQREIAAQERLLQIAQRMN